MMRHMFSNLLLLSFIILSWTSEIEYLVNLAKFPPVVDDVEGQPRGHMKPLGWQRPPEGPIVEYTEPLNANEFWNQHVRDHVPLVYHGYIKDSPAIEKWNDEYLAKTYGDLDVLVEHKLEDRTSTSGRMRLADFLLNYKDQDMYIVSMFPNEMMTEVKAIPSVLCGTFKDYAHESNFWMSSGGTRSVIHFDADHNIHCMLSGRKDFILIANNITTKTNLYYEKTDTISGSGHSFLDPDSIDMNKFKRISKVPWTYASLYPGDCIFIPSRYIHQVRGYGRTIAVTTLFTADLADKFNGDGCTDGIMKNYHSMAEIPFQWTYQKGNPTIDMGYLNVELVKYRVREMMADTEYTVTGKVSMEQFITIVGDFGGHGRNKTKIRKIWSDVFGFTDDFLLDSKAIDSISLEQWKSFCRALEDPHGVVTNGSEPVFIKPGERHKWEKEHPEAENYDNMMTVRQMEPRMPVRHDPMLNYKSNEEKQDYIKKLRKRIAKYGRNSVLLEGIEDEDEYANNDIKWVSELAWTLDEVPGKYHQKLLKGRIPLEYKDKFLESLSDVFKARFKEDFENNGLPEELLHELVNNPGKRKNPDKKRTTLSLRQKLLQLIQGLLPQEDVDLFIKNFPDYHNEFIEGKLPKTVMMQLIASNEQDYEKDLEKMKKLILSQKIEL